MEGITIKTYDHRDDWRQFQAYIKRAFHEKYVLSDERFFMWQYDGTLSIATAGPEIIGHLGFRDMQYKWREGTRQVRVLMNFFVEEPYRIAGIGSLLAQHAGNTNTPILVSGYTPLSQRLFPNIFPEWHEAGNLRRFFFIFNRDHPLLAGLSVPSTLPHDRGRNHQTAKEIEVARFDALYDTWWARARARYSITVERNSTYMNWRFVEHPLFSYRITAARTPHGTMMGYIIWRVEEDQGFRIVRIVDWISEKEFDGDLLSLFLARAKKTGAHMVDFMHSGHSYDTALNETGFFDAANTDFRDFPIWFNPISKRKTFVNVAYNFNTPLDECFLTKADGDQDRPNPR